MSDDDDARPRLRAIGWRCLMNLVRKHAARIADQLDHLAGGAFAQGGENDRAIAYGALAAARELRAALADAEKKTTEGGDPARLAVLDDDTRQRLTIKYERALVALDGGES